MTVDWEAMRVKGQTGSDGLSRAGCGERLEESLTGRGGGRIGLAGTRFELVAERVQVSTVRRRERDGHSCYSRKNR